jgi:PKD domain
MFPFRVMLKSTSSKWRAAASLSLLIASLVVIAISLSPSRTSAQGGNACTLPGVTVVTDPTGDEMPPGGPQQDIQSISIAELGTNTNALTFTLKVADLSGTLPSNSQWKVYFNSVDGTTYWVDMATASSNAVTFNYGTSATQVDTTVGTADSGTFFTDGTIRITISNSKVGNPAAGQTLTNVNGVVYTLVGIVLIDIDDTSNGTPPSASYTLVGNASCANASSPTPTPTPAPTATPAPTGAGAPRFFTYLSPQGVADSAGEPSIGSNWTRETVFHNTFVNGTDNAIPNGGSSLYFGGFLSALLKVTFSDCSSPATVTWDQKPLLSASTPRAAGDPILFTDHDTGRTFVAQLEGLTPAGATIDITDDDGDSFTPSDGVVPSDVDHETLGGGRYHDPLPNPGPLYPNAIYYASQSVAEARAFRSDNGGLLFSQAAAPMFTDADCAGLHGHVKVSPADGTVYVPDFACGGSLPFHNAGQQAVIVSEDNGITWTVRPIPDSSTSGVIQEPVVPGTAQTRDPSVAIATDGTVYFAYQAANGHSMVAVSHDKGVTWAPSVDVGANVVNGGPILNATMQAAVAGDPNRAAVAFFGTETGGNNWDCGSGNSCDYGPDFTGVWYLYVATTFDGGVTWQTQNITPGDPVQRGGICGGGTCRNLLDFFDATIDKEGRILIGYDDGCVSSTCITGDPSQTGGGKNDYTAKAAIGRQTGGKRMFAAFDPTEPAVPGAPMVSGSVNGTNTAATLTWPVPDNGGSDIISYNIYRGQMGDNASFTLIATVNETNYTDPNWDGGAKTSYRVTAVNAVGQGPFCQEFHPVFVALPNPCATPGVLVNDDTNADGSDNDSGANTPPDPSVNIRKVFIAEPDLGAGVNKLIFTMQLGGAPTAGSPPPNSQWYIIWNRQNPDPDFDRFYVAMVTDAGGTPSFEYGKWGVPLDATNPNCNSNTPMKVGDADSGNYDVANGVITITVSDSNLENIHAGQTLAAVNARTFFNRPFPPACGCLLCQRSQNNASDITNDSAYTLLGNAFCVSDHAPTAQLAASPTDGAAPLVVNFDGSASSDPDTGDSVASYTFSFGDGTPDVTQSSPTISHSYNGGGTFFATLTVQDTHGLQSLNTASVEIQTEANLLNLSTRGDILTGDNVLIAGIIITGTDPKEILFRGLGPSLAAKNVPGALQDPTLELHDHTGAAIAFNDNWKDTQQADIQATGLAPTDDRESAILQSLAPAAYTAIERGKNNTTGVGLVEAYDLDTTENSQLANISTRGLVGTGDHALIGGFIAGGGSAGPTRVVVRAIGPSLQSKGVQNALADPTLELHDGQGNILASNDNWKDTQQTDIQNSGLAPSDDRESAIFVPALGPGPYTAIVRGKNDTTGIGLVEEYNIH